jgi:hypothetical protein
MSRGENLGVVSLDVVIWKEIIKGARSSHWGKGEAVLEHDVAELEGLEEGLGGLGGSEQAQRWMVCHVSLKVR